MVKFFPLLLRIFFFYFVAWFYTEMRTESVLIATGKILNKILFFINSSRGISIVSIIIGLFAHFSLILLISFNRVISMYSELITITWVLMGFLLLSAGETIETYIKLKKAETPKKKREFLALIVILVCATVFILYYTVISALALCKLLYA